MTACSEKEIPASEFLSYINAFPDGLLKPDAAISIELASAQPDVEAGAEIKEQVFSFSPSVKGKAYWLDNRTIEFIPEAGGLKRGQVYKAEFALGKVVKNVEKRLKKFPFLFKVESLTMDFGSIVLDIPEPEKVNIRGEVRFSEAVAPETLKSAIKAGSLPVEVAKTDDQTVLRFAIDNISKQKNESEIKISIDGKPLEAEESLQKSVKIPASGVFAVLSTELVSEPENALKICFSEPLSSTQDLNGLITVPELNSFTVSVENNNLSLFFDRENITDKNVGSLSLTVDAGVRNSAEKPLGTPYSETLSLKSNKPKVEILKAGNIIPDENNIILPFRAVNLKAVDLKIIKIFENNILMFLQSNQLGGSNELRRSGRLVYSKTLTLNLKSDRDYDSWQNYSLDMSKIIRKDPGAVYRVELSFKQAYSTYPCENDTFKIGNSNSGEVSNIVLESDEMDDSAWDVPNTYYYDSNYDWELYDWQQTDNPCHPSYYMGSDRTAASNIMVSDIGLIAKGASSGQWWVSTANLLDTKPIKDAEVTFYNFQLQAIGVCKTDENGFATITPKGKPFIAKASAGGHNTYLRLVDGEENPLNRFDIDGKIIEKGLKGFIYGERGVWRPGDTLHLGFILYDAEKRIPDKHPVTLEVYNARGQFYAKTVKTDGKNGFYAFDLPTDANDPTGLWNAYVKVGGTTFHKSLRIETIKPNRLKINLSLPSEKIESSTKTLPVKINSSWLTGASARNLKTKVEVSFSRVNTQFKGYEKYLFNNPASDFVSSVKEVYDGALNESGEAAFNLQMPETANAPGMLNANFTCRVFEQGGDASIYSQSAVYSPYSSYVGINLNTDKNEVLETDKEHNFDLAVLTSDGKPATAANLEYRIYRIGWSWWWENNSESFSSYVNGNSYKPVAEGKLKTANGKASFSFKINYPEWGRYFVYVKNLQSGHATGGTVYVDWPEWRGQSKKGDPSGLKMLAFSTDKSSYEAGEEVTVIIPASGGGRALVALENGSKVISREWVKLAENEATKYHFKATAEMAPNFYVHISLLQPHAQTVNELPLRMYGVMPVMISNKASVLEPQIKMPEVLRPETEFTVEVSEKSGKPMTYTLAIVDEGLLDITNFKTPDPWTEFNAREALGVRTWDMYDYVMGAFGGKFAGMFAVGGDQTLKSPDARANRFKPVVKFIGPFSLAKGGKDKHKITLPAYVGSVRTMIVAAQDGTFGKAEATTPVRTPLMLLSSLPRVLSVNEEISLPVNIFAMENSVKDVSVKVETGGLLVLNDKNNKPLHFASPGDQMVYFSMKTGSKTGVEKVTITASGGGKTSQETIEIAVRNPNPAVVQSQSKLLEAGQSAEFSYQLTGASADDWTRLETSRIPSVNIVERFDYLNDYSHFCSEQLTSTALPLLYFSQFKDMDKTESAMVEQNIRTAIKNLYGRQLSNGGIVYWPGQSEANQWITNYAGTFLVLAREKGYEVNEGVLKKWLAFEQREARTWKASDVNNYYSQNSELTQADRLYALALAGNPESGAMNRLKEQKNLSQQARWRLAAAFALGGKTKPAEELIFNLSGNVEPYYSPQTYGSPGRDEALILQTLTLLGRKEQAFQQAQRLAATLSEQTYYETQSTAFALMAMGQFAEKTGGNINYDWTLNGKKQPSVKTAKAASITELAKGAGKIELTNRGSGLLYVNLTSKYCPLVDTLPAISENLKLEVSYADMDGKNLDVAKLAQGTDFVATVKVANTSPTFDYSDLALTQIIPAGWEIFSEQATDAAYTYRDIRDDRVLTYFSLYRGQSKTFKIRLQTTYIGVFALPAVSCEDMYNTTGRARTRAAATVVERQ
jgi:uncharacterized protein YfaS (alpha-2-macroglobulin family)